MRQISTPGALLWFLGLTATLCAREAAPRVELAGLEVMTDLSAYESHIEKDPRPGTRVLLVAVGEEGDRIELVPEKSRIHAFEDSEGFELLEPTGEEPTAVELRRVSDLPRSGGRLSWIRLVSSDLPGAQATFVRFDLSLGLRVTPTSIEESAPFALRAGERVTVGGRRCEIIEVSREDGARPHTRVEFSITGTRLKSDEIVLRDRDGNPIASNYDGGDLQIREGRVRSQTLTLTTPVDVREARLSIRVAGASRETVVNLKRTAALGLPAAAAPGGIEVRGLRLYRSHVDLGIDLGPDPPDLPRGTSILFAIQSEDATFLEFLEERSSVLTLRDDTGRDLGIGGQATLGRDMDHRRTKDGRGVLVELESALAPAEGAKRLDLEARLDYRLGRAETVQTEHVELTKGETFTAGPIRGRIAKRGRSAEKGQRLRIVLELQGAGNVRLLALLDGDGDPIRYLPSGRSETGVGEGRLTELELHFPTKIQSATLQLQHVVGEEESTIPVRFDIPAGF